MKKIGLIGGMSWESTASYYRVINEEVKNRLGGLHSAKCLLASVDFAEIASYQMNGQWDEIGEILGEAAVSLWDGGADFIVICTNTAHKVAPIIQSKVNIPLLHIADVTGDKVLESGMKNVALLGTRYTMELDFYKDILQEKGINVLTPNADDRELVNTVIFDELCVGEINEGSREQYVRIMKDLVAQGAEGIILGCTEIGLLIGETDIDVPLFDTATIHAVAAVEVALK